MYYDRDTSGLAFLEDENSTLNRVKV
ncbi:MAG: hypothetical protein J07AB43_12590 [Candidatus Nanosalina sp. J07AB43]|nr:MAG: hypothetical protein J07AB43_12590 [Candidatus Nanosalina sp. J07AB43]